MPIPGCKLRKCKGRRGCLCPSRPAKAQPYAHVSGGNSTDQARSSSSRPAAAAQEAVPAAHAEKAPAATKTPAENIAFAIVAPPGKVSIALLEDGDDIVGLELGQEYFCDVEEDPEEAKKERKAYKATSVDNTVATGDGAALGEDSASCSCIEGNPCAVQYNCKNWNNRFEVAKANGWKGF
eukprot:gene2369-32902_t